MPRASNSKATTTKTSGRSCYTIQKEIKKWLILITDDNLIRRQRREHALHFLGAADSTLVTLQSSRQKPVRRTSKATIPGSWLCKRDVPLAKVLPHINIFILFLPTKGMLLVWGPPTQNSFSCIHYSCHLCLAGNCVYFANMYCLHLLHCNFRLSGLCIRGVRLTDLRSNTVNYKFSKPTYN